jgi:hypothetical protein
MLSNKKPKNLDKRAKISAPVVIDVDTLVFSFAKITTNDDYNFDLLKKENVKVVCKLLERLQELSKISLK